MSVSEFPVLIVGAGPTGVMLAIELARRGVEVSVLDKQPACSPESRAIGIHARTLEIFDLVGVAEQVLEAGHRLDGFLVHTRARRTLRIRFAELDSPYPFLITLSQAETQRILDERLGHLGIRIQRGVEVLDVREAEDGVEVRTAGGLVRAGWVVGCDGAHSIVRRRLGLSFEGADYAQDWLMAEARIDWPLARNYFHVFAYVDPPFPVFPMPGGRCRVFVPEVANRARHGLAPDFEEIERLAASRGPAGMKLSDPSLLATFRCYRRSSKVMRSGRILIAGDAAHIHSPAGGQGMNTGLHDAFNLGWKLALVCQGHAPATLLDTYEQERVPVAASVLALTHGLVRIFTLSSPPKRWLRDRLLPAAAAVPGARLRYANRMSQLSHNYRGGPLAPAPSRARPGSLVAGDRLPDVGGLRCRGEAVSIFDLLRSAAHTLFVFPGQRQRSAAAEASVAHFAAWQTLVVTIVIASGTGVADSEVTDPELRAHRRYGALHGRLVLVRPDGYIARTASLGRAQLLESYLRGLVPPSEESDEIRMR
jgi:2-polyprenyl-6-methoxyphenol hydroxylase-like FAD-dependent oxidoreductase